MAALTSGEILAITLIVVLGVVVVGLAFVLARRLRQRRAKLLHELTDRPELIQDRAFNRLGMARREAELVSRQGGDVARARELIAEGQAAYDNRSYDQAYRDAQMAHEALVDARRTGRLPDQAPGPIPAPSAQGSTAGPLPSTAAAAPPVVPPMPKNRAESQFQLRLLDQELATARTSRPRSAQLTEASELKSRGQAAFDRADYSEAFRLALKGRRALGGTVESLPPTLAFRGNGSTVPPAAPGAAVDPTATAERFAAGERCPECGYPALAGDAFCRGCGTPRTPAVCSSCGAVRAPADTFCGKCGTRFS